jgi:hypothetical protein
MYEIGGRRQFSRHGDGLPQAPLDSLLAPPYGVPVSKNEIMTVL